jgi:hypothetical protein
MSPEGVTIRLDDNRRNLAVWVQKAQHVIGGAPLLLAGISRISAPGAHGDLFAMAEIIVAAVLLVMFARDLRAEALTRVSKPALHEPPHRAHAGPEWIAVLAGVLLILEAVHPEHPGGKPLYERANFYLGAVTLLAGLAHGYLSTLAWKRRFIRIDDAGVHVRLSRFRKFDVVWPDLIDMEFHDDAVIIHSKSERQLIPLGPYGNATEIRDTLRETFARRALPGAT